jgi:hypothetical protein
MSLVGACSLCLSYPDSAGLKNTTQTTILYYDDGYGKSGKKKEVVVSGLMNPKRLLEFPELCARTWQGARETGFVIRSSTKG